VEAVERRCGQVWRVDGCGGWTEGVWRQCGGGVEGANPSPKPRLLRSSASRRPSRCASTVTISAL
jgi:hypothetical protein